MFEQDTKPGHEWVGFFAQPGIGHGFRYFTGVVEIPGGLLLLTPWTVTAGLALPACTMGCAAVIDIFVVGRPEFSIFSGGIMVGLVIFYLHRRD